MTEYAVGVVPVRLVGRIVEAQHAVVEKVGDPEFAIRPDRRRHGGIHGIGRRLGIAPVLAAVDETGLAEHAIGIDRDAGRQHVPGPGGGVVVAKDPVVAEIYHPEATRGTGRHVGRAIETTRRRRIGSGGQVGLADHPVGGDRDAFGEGPRRRVVEEKDAVLVESATHRFPAESIVNFRGKAIDVSVVPGEREVKSG